MLRIVLLRLHGSVRLAEVSDLGTRMEQLQADASKLNLEARMEGEGPVGIWEWLTRLLENGMALGGGGGVFLAGGSGVGVWWC